MKRRVLSVVLCVSICLSLFTVAFAAEGKLESIVRTVKGRLSVPADFTEFQNEKYESENGDIFYLMWEKEDGSAYISVAATEDGAIRQFDTWDRTKERPKSGVAAFTKEEYTKKAQEWFVKVNPKYAAEFLPEETELPFVGSHIVYVRLDRYVNGIPVRDDYASISVNKYTGEITSMFLNRTEVKNVIRVKEPVPEESAADTLGKSLGLYAEYRVPEGETTAMIVYTPKRRGTLLDARSGEEFVVSYLDSETGKGEAESEDSSAGGALNENALMDKGELTEKELAEIEELSSLLSKNRVEENIRKLAGTAAAGYDLKTISYLRSRSEDDEEIYIATAFLQNGEKTARVTLNAKTGKLIGISGYRSYVSDEKRGSGASLDDMKLNAERFIRTHLPEADGKIKLCDEEMAEKGYLRYCRVENEIPFDANYVNVTIDKLTGKITGYSKRWQEGLSFASAEKIITAEQAAEKYTTHAPVKLVYVANKIKGGRINVAEELVPVYVLSSDAPAYISAETGEALDYSLGVHKEESFALQKDLKGHWAENIIATLAENGIVFFKEEAFWPDKELFEQELILMLFSAERGGYIEPTEENIESLVEEAYARGLIRTKKDPDPKVRRDEAIGIIIRFLGYEKVAELRGIYKTGFADEKSISEKELGYVAIAKGLGIVSGSGNGKFNPAGNVTRAEFAAMLYNAITKR